VAGVEAGGVAAIGAAFQHGMADEARGDAGIVEQHGFEGQQAEDAIHPLPHLLHPPWPPRPDLRRDIVDDGDAERLHAFGQPQREAGAVDGNDQGGAAGGDVRHRLRHAARQVADIRQHLDQPHQREFAHREQALHALFSQPFAADPGEGQLRPPLAQRAHKPRAERIAGGFAGHDVDEHYTNSADTGAGIG
jgi:hypothetical protein